MTPLERLAQTYWDAFRTGFLKVGGSKEYPKWNASTDPVKVETARCLRFAIETLKDLPDECFGDDAEMLAANRGKFVAVLERAFPEPLLARTTDQHLTASEVLLSQRL